MLQSFEPIVDSRSRVLVLGTMPGVISLQKQQYYAHPRNGFWQIVAALAAEPLPQEYAPRRELLLRTGIALWDVCRCCEREGSLDSNICREEPNDIVRLLVEHPAIRAVAFNGQPAYRLFRRHIAPGLPPLASPGVLWDGGAAGELSGAQRCPQAYTLLQLPSTSPAHAVSFDKKLQGWLPLASFR